MRRRSFGVMLGVIALLAAAAGLSIVLALQSRFGGYDLSPLIDAGWRVASGQRPNRDFICTFPPLLYLGAAAAFRVFGVRWVALSICSVLYTYGLVMLGLRVISTMRREIDAPRLLFLSAIFAALEFVPSLLVGHPWHSSWTEEAALYAVLSTFAVALLSSRGVACGRELRVHLALAECLLLLGKPNTALPALGVCFLCLLLRPNRWRNLVDPLAGAVCLASGVLLLVGTNLLTTFRLYFQLSTRLGLENSGFADLFANPIVPGGLPDFAVYLAILPSLALTLILGSLAMRSRELAWVGVLAFGSCAVTVLGLGTNVEFRLIDVPCVVLGAVLLGAIYPMRHREFLGGILTQSIFALVMIGVFYSGTRARMRAVGLWGGDSCGVQSVHTDRFFGRFSACSGFFGVLSEVDAALRAHPTTNVFFGPRIEFFYARNRIASPRELPLWWHPGSSFPVTETAKVVEAWRRRRFEMLVFAHRDRTRIPQAILDLIARDYRELPDAEGADREPEAHVDVYLRR